MKLKLEKPIAFFDLETTGIDVATDRIVEIAVLKIRPDGQRDMKVRRVNPGIPIPKASSDIHGITDEDVKDAPTFDKLAKSLYIMLQDCDLGGYNSNRFDVPLLAEEFLRAGVDFSIEGRRLIDVQGIFFKKEKRTLAAAFQFYCDKPLDGAHSAEADISATHEILEAQLDKYSDLENDMDFLADYSKQQNFADLAGRFVFNADNEVVFNFGKHKNVPVATVLKNEPGYYGWMMGGDFPLFTKKILKQIKEAI
ncbi:MAG: 3'-5' exonuclease [Bacteroidetes bacterium]|nr:3'-5' exonuclease [Bacteroidota bacterium]